MEVIGQLKISVQKLASIIQKLIKKRVKIGYYRTIKDTKKCLNIELEKGLYIFKIMSKDKIVKNNLKSFANSLWKKLFIGKEN